MVFVANQADDRYQSEKMTIPAASLITLILTISLSASLELQPEIKVEGSPYFLAVFDLHKETDDDDNNCINLSAKGIDAMMALQWSNEYLNNNNQTNIGKACITWSTVY